VIPHRRRHRRTSGLSPIVHHRGPLGADCTFLKRMRY
jgi:hypothetical protein